ncbi:MAG: hypothetical protein ACJAVW_003570, partial [Spirosomataceae bacterium]
WCRGISSMLRKSKGHEILIQNSSSLFNCE